VTPARQRLREAEALIENLPSLPELEATRRAMARPELA